MDAVPRVCAGCRVLVEPHGDGWRHIPEFAEKFSRNVCMTPAPGRLPSGSEARFGLARVKVTGRDKFTLKDEIEELALPPDAPVTIGVDGSYKLTVGERVSKPMSYGWLTTSGLYGLGTFIASGKISGGDMRADGDDPARTLQAELRAMAAALAAVPETHPVTVLSDSRSAVGFMQFWRDGHDVMPGGYDPARASGREATLARLARRAREAGDRITVTWLPGHSGHPLNDAAHQLARMARLWATGTLERETVAADARQVALAALRSFDADAVA
jgi:ribonuclease HI